MARPNRIRIREDEIRQRIKTAELVNRLQDEGLGKITLEDGQRESIKILLKKSLPDLANIEISGNDDKPIGIKLTWAIQ